MVRRARLMFHLAAEFSHDMEVPPTANIASPGLCEERWFALWLMPHRSRA